MKKLEWTGKLLHSILISLIERYRTGIWESAACRIIFSDWCHIRLRQKNCGVCGDTNGKNVRESDGRVDGGPSGCSVIRRTSGKNDSDWICGDEDFRGSTADGTDIKKVMFFFYVERCTGLMNEIVKKTKKTPAKEIEKAGRLLSLSRREIRRRSMELKFSSSYPEIWQNVMGRGLVIATSCTCGNSTLRFQLVRRCLTFWSGVTMLNCWRTTRRSRPFKKKNQKMNIGASGNWNVRWRACSFTDLPSAQIRRRFCDCPEKGRL